MTKWIRIAALSAATAGGLMLTGTLANAVSCNSQPRDCESLAEGSRAQRNCLAYNASIIHACNLAKDRVSPGSRKFRQYDRNADDVKNRMESDTE